jgi:uncharacterized membrane protein
MGVAGALVGAVALAGCYSGSAQDRYFRSLNGAQLTADQRNELLSLGEAVCDDVAEGATEAEAARRTAERVASTPDLQISSLGAAQLTASALRYLCPDAG